MLIISDFYNIINNNIIIIISLLLILFAIIVLTRINPMISLFNLIIFYVLLGILLYKLNLNVLGLLYILIYVGAISVLFIFILSLINIKYSEVYYQSYYPDLLLIINTLILTTILSLIIISYSLNIELLNIDLISQFINNNSISNNLNSIIEFKTIGELLYTDYSIVFILLGTILLLSILSAILLLFRTNTSE